MRVELISEGVLIDRWKCSTRTSRKRMIRYGIQVTKINGFRFYNIADVLLAEGAFLTNDGLPRLPGSLHESEIRRRSR